MGVQLSISTYGILYTGKNCETTLVANSVDVPRQRRVLHTFKYFRNVSIYRGHLTAN